MGGDMEAIRNHLTNYREKTLAWVTWKQIPRKQIPYWAVSLAVGLQGATASSKDLTSVLDQAKEFNVNAMAQR